LVDPDETILEEEEEVMRIGARGFLRAVAREQASMAKESQQHHQSHSNTSFVQMNHFSTAAAEAAAFQYFFLSSAERIGSHCQSRWWCAATSSSCIAQQISFGIVSSHSTVGEAIEQFHNEKVYRSSSYERGITRGPSHARTRSAAAAEEATCF
jgi:hypothetical protein